MFFRLLFLCIFSLPLFAVKLPFNLTAKEVSMKENEVEARNGVVINGNGYLFRADYAKYNNQTKELFLEGDVEVLKDSQIYLKSEKLKANVSLQKGLLEPFFILEKANGVWISSKKASLEDKVYTFESCLLSSCSPKNPKWFIRSSETSFDQNDSTISAYNPTLYFFDFPVFYLPYLWFSIDQTRRSGLLIPRVGYSDKDGFLYEQPIYVAPMDSWDLELMPQIRTLRGKGIYSEFRFVDTNDSEGSIKLGYFKDQGAYARRENLEHDSHYGYELRYKNDSLLEDQWKVVEDDSLYLNWSYLNDIDYINLQRDAEVELDQDKLVTSELNYAATTENNYVALYNKYFIDTSLKNNDTTLQQYPSAQYHRYTSTLFNDYVLYSLDYKYSNYRRESGLNAQMNEFNAPVGVVIPLANNFLTFSYFLNFYFNNTSYTTPNMLVTQNYDDGNFARSFNRFTLETDLTKKYEDFLHTINVRMNYIRPGFKSTKGYYPDFITLPSESEEVRLELSQYFYDNNLFNFLYHKLSQPYYIDEYDTKYGELENELRFKFGRVLEVYNRLRYDHEAGRLSSSNTGITVDYHPYKFGFSHYYTDDSYGDISDFYIAELDREFQDFSLYGKIGYDNDDRFVRWWEAGIYESSRCLDYKISLRRETTPVLKATGASSIDETKIYVELDFVPLFGVRHSIGAD